jgi:hypothetical protein
MAITVTQGMIVVFYALTMVVFMGGLAGQLGSYLGRQFSDSCSIELQSSRLPSCKQPGQLLSS